MKRITGDFCFDFITSSAINKEKLERKLTFALNDTFSSVLHDLDIEALDSEPTLFEPMDIEDIEDDDPLPYSTAVKNHE